MDPSFVHCCHTAAFPHLLPPLPVLPSGRWLWSSVPSSASSCWHLSIRAEWWLSCCLSHGFQHTCSSHGVLGVSLRSLLTSAPTQGWAVTESERPRRSEMPITVSGRTQVPAQHKLLGGPQPEVLLHLHSSSSAPCHVLPELPSNSVLSHTLNKQVAGFDSAGMRWRKEDPATFKEEGTASLLTTLYFLV